MPFVVTGENFTHRFKITVLAAKVFANETNIPVYFDLSNAPAGFWTHVKSDGGDIRITQSDGVTRQALELVHINTSSNIGEIHYKASSLSSSGNTDFYVVYGNAGASQPAVGAAYGRNSVWTDYEDTSHLTEQGNGTPGEYVDSTGNGHDGVGATAPTQITFGLGKGQNFSNINNKIDCGTGAGLDVTTEDFTIQFIFESKDLNAEGVIICRGVFDSKGYYVQIRPIATYNDMSLSTMHPSRVLTATDGNFMSQDETILVHITKIGTGANNVTIYKNGADYGSYSSRGSHGNITSAGAEAFLIGQYCVGGSPMAAAYIDEVRFIKTGFDSDRTATENNMLMDNSNFITVGSEEEAPQIFYSRAFIID